LLTETAPARPGEDEILLHICCGPCAVAPVQALRAEGRPVTGLWFNPNIHPAQEYGRRLDSCRAFAAAEALPLVEVGDYGLRQFIARVYPHDDMDARGARCLECYRWRMTATARIACERGFAAMTTTLLVSPHQQHDAIATIGAAAAAQYGVRFEYRDWRPAFRPARGRSRQLGLYHQQYCGCLLSEAERFAAQVSGLGRDDRPGK
jgi:predicted adenine nucleotide alpha hydrolase (AANH) superfamily ATPase